MLGTLRGLRVFLIIALLCAVPAPSYAAFNFDIGFSVNVGPPALPYYAQPPCPQPNFLWMPGYWAWGPGGYYWVPGTWVAAAGPGLLWTPGYWSNNGDNYVWDAGYWAPQVGFYGGINYGYGYYGGGYAGGAWSGNTFRYNTAVTNVNRTVIRNVYINKTVVNNYYNSPNAHRVSFNGRGGVIARPNAAQLAVRRERHIPLTTIQRQHIETAAANRNLYASVNKGRPREVAVARPFAPNRKPANFAPIRAADRTAQNHVVARRPATAPHAAPVARPIRPQTVRPQPVRPVTKAAPMHQQPQHAVVQPKPVTHHVAVPRPQTAPMRPQPQHVQRAPQPQHAPRPQQHAPRPQQHAPRPQQHAPAQHAAPQHAAPQPHGPPGEHHDQGR